jgi:hypothetical protein
VRIVLSRKGFDSGSGGCASPILPDGSMLALPIPDKSSPVRYADLTWKGRNVGELVERLTRGKQRAHYGAHVDPDVREELRARKPGWKPALGVCRSAAGHLRNEGVREGDLFLFWGLFRPVSADLAWAGDPVHAIWGWLQVGAVVPVDEVRSSLARETHAWMADHPHLAFPVGTPNNTLYVAASRLELPGQRDVQAPAAGVFDAFAASRQLTAPGAAGLALWRLPGWFLPRGRAALSYHADADRWTACDGGVLLRSASRGQEFVLDADLYPEAVGWAASLVHDRG